MIFSSELLLPHNKASVRQGKMHTSNRGTPQRGTHPTRHASCLIVTTKQGMLLASPGKRPRERNWLPDERTCPINPWNTAGLAFSSWGGGAGNTVRLSPEPRSTRCCSSGIDGGLHILFTEKLFVGEGYLRTQKKYVCGGPQTLLFRWGHSK